MKHGSVVLVALSVLLIAGCSSEIRPPDVPAMSESDRENQAAIDLGRFERDLLRDFPDAVVPSVERVRFIQLNEWAETIAACLTDEGFTATADDGGLGSSPPGGQEEPYALAYYACNAKYPVDPRVMVPLNEDQIRYLYEYYTKVMTPCLNAEGFDVSPAPSLQTFISTYGQDGAWEPYGETARSPKMGTNEEWAAINKKCPQLPDGLYGN